MKIVTNSYIRCIAFVAPLILFACATPYQEMGFMGGVEFNQLNKSIFEIRARGNKHTRSGVIKDYAMLKASELCLRNGFRTFIPIESRAFTKTGTIQDNNYVTRCYGDNCYTSGGGSSSYSKARQNITVKMFAKGEDTPSTAYSCSIIYKNLAKKYK